MGRSKLSTRSRAVALTAAVVAASACVMLLSSVAGAATVRTAQKATASPFTAAAVSSSNGAYRISWHSDARKVTVFATHDPADLTSGTKVGTGGASAHLTVTGLAAGSRWYFRLTTGAGRSLVVAQHLINVDGVPNFRDLGGYRTADGRWIKEGLLFRSSMLNKITAAGLTTLSQLGIVRDIDLRTPSEVTADPDPAIPGVTYVADSIVPDNDPDITHLVANLALIPSFKLMGYAFGSYRSLYLELGASPTCVYGYRVLYHNVLAVNGQPLVFHCTHGDDRTGWGAFVLLRILGVPTKTATQDYLVSNACNKAMLASYSAPFLASGFTKQQSDFSLKRAYLEAAMQALDTTYGSFGRYVRLGLGLSRTDVQTLRDTYLAS